MNKHHSFYISFLLVIIVINELVYLNTKTYASYSSIIKNHFTENIQLQNCDVVLRNGKGLFSTIFRNSSLQEPKFTHAGFLCKINKEWFVYHFMDDNKQSGLRIETLPHFINDDVCTDYAFYRYTLSTQEQQRLVSMISASQKQIIPFDSNFNLATDSAMYCTEWIAKALDKATSQKDFIPQTTVGNYNYIAPDNLYLNAHCKLIYDGMY